VVFHGVLVSAALALVSELTLPPQLEVFTWDVAVVETPTPPEPVAASTPPPVAPAPPTPQPVKTPVPKKSDPVKPEPVVQAQQPVESIQPVQETQPIREHQLVQETEPVREHQLVQETEPVREHQPVQETQALTTAQPVRHTMAEQVATATQPVQTDTRPSREVTHAVSRSHVPVESAESVEQTVATVQSVAHTETTVQDHAVASAPAASERALIEASHAPIETAQKVEQPVAAQALPAVQQRVMRHMPVRTRPAAQPDYGWLAQALWANVEQRKRYPSEAKLNRWEGKVVLRLTIEQRGTSIYLVDLALEESSGHAVLDRHTQEVVRKAFPIKVKHTLAQPQIQLYLPFSYSMD
jgi:TonB family protein